MPLFHVGGLSILVRSALYGTTAVVHERLDPSAVEAALEDEAITLLSLTATLLRRWLEVRETRRPPPFCAHPPWRRPLPTRAPQGVGKPGLEVAPTYGLTEAYSQVAPRIPGDSCFDTLTPLPGFELPVVGDDGANTSTSEPGEIWIRGPSVIRAYLTPGGGNPRSDGWLATGDIGTLNERGRLEVFDLRTDLTISGGENLYPAQVKATLTEHPGVAEAAVAPVDDPTYGQCPAAWFIPAPGETQPSAESLDAHCRQHIAGYKAPVAFHPLKDLPRTSSGKILRRKLHH